MLVLAWLVTKRSPHTRAAYLRDLAQQAASPGTAGYAGKVALHVLARAR